MSNLLDTINPMPAYIPQAKAWGLGGKIDKISISVQNILSADVAT